MGERSVTAAFRLGEWLVEPALDAISRGGTVHHLRPRLMDLLVFMARRQGDVLSKDEILSEVWRRQFVAESVLSRSIADLRRLLGDVAAQPRVIETIPKRGYRLIAAVMPQAQAPLGARPALAIAVLPFVDMADGHDQGYFCEGLAEELTNSLAHVPGLRVVARTSAFAFKDRAVDVREIGRMLGVGFVVEGGVQRAGNRLRVTVQLIDVADGCHVWSERFAGAAGDVFLIQDEITRAVVSALPATLPVLNAARFRRGATSSPAAHDLYLRGRHLAAQRNPAALAEALVCYARALAADPDYAAALAAVAECHCVCGFTGFARPSEAFPLGRAAAERALAIDPELADAHAALGHECGMYEWQWAGAERHFRRALDLNPGHALARVWYSHLLAASGRFTEAIDVTERACEFDPLSPTVETTLGLALYYAGEYERAAACYRRVLEAAPDFALARMHLGRVHVLEGRFQEAVDQLTAAARALPLALGFLAGTWRRIGNAERVAALMADLDRLARSGYVSPLTWFCAWHGEREEQYRWLARAFDERVGIVPLLNTDPSMDEWRRDPRFLALIDRLGLPHVPSRQAAAGRHSREVDAR